ncbi:ribosomal RNA small subunit methyltransferase E [Synergistales bacterium]|nr:ribosomal RNA small subunit methyltransferase E [Synergistales bacterium]
MSLPKVRLKWCKQTSDDCWQLDREQERHITKALRCYEGALLQGLLDDGKLLLRLGRDERGFFVREAGAIEPEPLMPDLTLLLGMLKHEQFDTVLRSSAELGVYELKIILCERSVPRISEEELPKKLGRWRRILDEGAKVAGFSRVTNLSAPTNFRDVKWEDMPQTRFVASISADAAPIFNTLRDITGSVAVAVGPEGDWTDDEMTALTRNSFHPVSLGPGILRASTAAIAACGILRMARSMK